MKSQQSRQFDGACICFDNININWNSAVSYDKYQLNVSYSDTFKSSQQVMCSNGKRIGGLIVMRVFFWGLNSYLRDEPI